MKLIFAQGNPGAEYANSRHNIGFMILDFFASEQDLNFQSKSKFQAEIAEFTSGDNKIILAKPQTFYNLTGQSAKLIADFYKIPPQNILVIHDDLALNFGTLRIRRSGSDAGNNGVKSLNSHLGENYWRLRVGIGSDLQERIPDADFVLGKLTEVEVSCLKNSILPETNRTIIEFTKNELEVTSKKI